MAGTTKTGSNLNISAQARPRNLLLVVWSTTPEGQVSRRRQLEEFYFTEGVDLL